MTYPVSYHPKSLNYKLIKKITEDILKENNIDLPPVPIKDIIEMSGVEVVFGRFKELRTKIAGFTDFKESKIYINADDALNRQTFTMAHEYGHWILHKNLFESNPDEYRVLLRTSQKTDDPLEKEANSFAANLLVPEFLIKPIKDRALKSQLSLIFLVSSQTIDNRLEYL